MVRRVTISEKSQAASYKVADIAAPYFPQGRNFTCLFGNSVLDIKLRHRVGSILDFIAKWYYVQADWLHIFRYPEPCASQVKRLSSILVIAWWINVKERNINYWVTSHLLMNMTGRFKWFVAGLKQDFMCVGLHFFIHRETLRARTVQTDIKSDLNSVVNMVTLVKFKAIETRLPQYMDQYTGSRHYTLVPHT